MKRSKKLLIESRILCEDIRQERNNKFILIGVYSGDILVGQLPAPIPLAIFIEGTTQAKEGELWLRLSGPGEGTAKMKLSYVRAGGGDRITLATPTIEVLAAEEGKFLVETSPDGETWEYLLHRNVSQREGLWALTPIAFGLPSEQSPSDAQETSSPPEPSRPGSRGKRQRS